ncbi:hypothetical protein WMY93_020413 [Mugilogobius chulae]|uniref:C2H2-type domain-containing protein n=1 Tax=Mugilogobius chulae TaxID=88201 RepID=A0AAW0NS99_9GOBI
MVKQQQRRTDRCFLPVGSNNVTLVRFPTQRRQQAFAHEIHQPHQAPVRETEGDDGETEAKRICLSGSDETLTNRETAPESCDQTGSTSDSLEGGVSAADGAQQEALESSEDDRAAELACAGGLKVTIQIRGESREFGEQDPASERLTCHVCHCTCPSAQSFQQHMSGSEHQTRLKYITQSISQKSRWRGGASERWCDVCQDHFTGDVILHRRTAEHKECKKSSRPFCSNCNRHFRTPRKFVEHMKSPEHKKQIQQEKPQEEEMITVDAVGCFESEPKMQFRGDEETGDKDLGNREGTENAKDETCGDEEMRREESSEGDEETQQGERIGTTELEGDEDIGNRLGDEDIEDQDRGGGNIEDEEREDEDIGDEERGDEDIGNTAGGDEEVGDKNLEDEDLGEEALGNKDLGDEETGGTEDAEDRMEADVNQTSNVNDDDVSQESDPHTVYGMSHVIPVRGFFCCLCHKFFFKESSARDQHCRTKQHLTRLKQSQSADLSRAVHSTVKNCE